MHKRERIRDEMECSKRKKKQTTLFGGKMMRQTRKTELDKRLDSIKKQIVFIAISREKLPYSDRYYPLIHWITKDMVRKWVKQGFIRGKITKQVLSRLIPSLGGSGKIQKLIKNPTKAEILKWKMEEETANLVLSNI